MTARLASLLALPLLASLAGTAHADDSYPPPPAQELPPPAAGAPVYYPTPMQQTVQTTYVPQSVAMSGPEEIDAEEGHRAPVGYTAVQRTRKGMLIGGGVTLGVSYFYAALFAAAAGDINNGYDEYEDKNELRALWIPVAGPFIQMAETDSDTGKVLLGVLGGAQVVGAVMLYKGLTTKKTVYVRNDLVGELAIAPMIGTDNAGLVVGGRF